MHVLVAVASRHGATRGIAERIADTLRANGLDVDLLEASSVRRLDGYDAFVIGGAAYMFHWLGEATKLVRRNRATLATKPTWLFSSGPLGSDPLDEEGRDQKVVTIPKEFPELIAAVGARDARVFFGAYTRDRRPIGVAERLMSFMPARVEIPEGDFRDWPEIEAWAAGIAAALAREPVG